LRRALRFLFTGRDEEADYRLVLVAASESPAAFRESMGPEASGAGTAVVMIDGKRTHFLDGAETHSRISPMCARLALLGCDFAHGVTLPLPEEARKLPARDALRALLRGSASNEDEAGPRTPKALADSAFEYASALKLTGRVPEALAEVKAALQRGIRSPELMNLLGHLECMGSRTEEGKAAFQAVIAEWPGFAKAHINLSVLYWNEGDRAQALDSLGRGLQADPYDRESVLNGIRLYKSAGRQEQAAAAGAAYLRAKPQDAELIRSTLAEG
jgi:tetratricopeptide (TPR) repeat protein